MRMALAGLVVALISAAALGDEKSWEYHDGIWSAVNIATPASTRPINEPELDRAERLLFQNDYKTALEVLLDWEKDNKHSPGRDRCINLLAEDFYQSGDRIKSFYYLDELMDEYPESALFQPALEKQFQIAEAYLDGYKSTFLWMPIVGHTEEGVEMMYRIQQRSPGSPLAERAMLRTADFYFSDQQYEVAQDAYTMYARNYPRSPAIPRVRLRAAFSSLAQFRGVPFNATAIIDARAQLVDIEKRYPAMAAEENVASVIEQIDSRFASKILETAKFYGRTHEIKGSVYLYRCLVQQYPNSPQAGEARSRLAEMPATAMSDPPPPRSPGYWPTTEPTLTIETQ